MDAYSITGKTDAVSELSSLVREPVDVLSDVAELAFVTAVSKITRVPVSSILEPLATGLEATDVDAIVEGHAYRAITPVGKLLVVWNEDQRFGSIDVGALMRTAVRYAFVPVSEGMNSTQRKP